MHCLAIGRDGRHHHCAVLVLLLKRLPDASRAPARRLLPGLARIVHPQRHVLHAVPVAIDVVGNRAPRPQRRGQHQPDLALLKYIGGPVALACLRSRIGHQLVPKRQPVVVSRLPRVAYIELHVVRTVQRQKVRPYSCFTVCQCSHIRHCSP